MDMTACLGTMMVPVVVAICLCVGYVIKNAVPSDAVNRYIPLVVAALGVALNAWVAGWAVTPEVIAGGLVSGLASTGMYELLRHLIENPVDGKGGED